MDTTRRVLVTGATGNVGPHAVAQLLRAGVPTRALLLPDDPHADRVPAAAEVCHGDLADPAGLDACLEGVDAVFLMWPFFTLDVATVPAVLDKLREHDCRVVFVSSIGVHIGLEPVDNNCHAYLEQQIEKAGLEWTFLQTTGFDCNARLSWAAQLQAGDVVRSPYGEAARTPVHEADVAAVAVRALTEDGHAGKRYVTTGPQALTQIEQLRIIGEVAGRDLRWEDVPGHAARAAMVEAGWPEAYAAGALDYFETLVDQPETLTDHVAGVLGRPPRTFREWAEEHAGDFR
ncbi:MULTISPECIES: SDR family oxidoreductase [unclassified Streptomyces]|uniref:SDR family oxidoreductase n=1 Tax=unclassified Streptomyces TaxID=2593676 RepID=UPI00278C8EA5|nr:MULTISPECIES: NAD(P)H-binding protein [unclassified Streptomyces]